MEPSFWQKKWTDNQIGFHRKSVHPRLEANFSQYEKESKILVPLCGKSLDMIWLKEKGFAVTGVELSQKAVDAFFAENTIPHTKEQEGFGVSSEGGGIKLHCGDIFKLPREMKEVGFDGIYDRAALVALPQSMREKYSKVMKELIVPGGRYLLVAFDYPQELVSGPPFSVPEAEVRDLFEDSFNIEILEKVPTEVTNPRMNQAGVTEVVETVYLLTRSNHGA